MKITISIDVELYKKVEKLSVKLQVSRNKLIAQALDNFIEKSESLEITQKLNKVYRQDGTKENIATKISKSKIKKINDKW